MTAADRTPKPCLHKQADHQHGTPACYALDSCRCWPCCLARSQYDEQRRRDIAYGRTRLVDAGPVRERVAALIDSGVGLKYVAKHSGVAHGALWKLMYGKTRADGSRVPSKRVSRTTADRLLALAVGDPSLLADGARTTSVGTARRLQALACAGWSVNALAAEAGLDRQRLDRAILGGQVVASTVRAVAALYDRLWDVPPPADDHRSRISVSRTRNAAVARGWVPPMAWDDESIDDPQARPDRGHRVRKETGTAFDEVAVARAMHGDPVHLRPIERAEVVHRLTAAGHTAADIATRLGIDKRSVQRIRDQRRKAEEAA